MTNLIHNASVSLLGAFAFTAGCVDPAGPSIDPIANKLEAGRGAPCTQEWRCGANSPVLDNQRGFHELGFLGQWNDAGLRLHSPSMVKDGRFYDLAIETWRIVGYPEDGGIMLEGQDLVGAEILLDAKPVLADGDLPDTAAGIAFDNDAPIQLEAYRIPIRRVTEMNFPFPKDSTDIVETYVFGWSDSSGNDHKYLCNNPPFYLSNSHNGPSELLGMDPADALVFEGDRIFPDTKTMNTDDQWDPSWFNIGCAGDTPAKLHLTRNTLASGTPSYTATWQKRQGALKLLTADYCGTGRAFTVPGQPLQWRGQATDPHNSFWEPVLPDGEAQWDENGATCITMPRMALSKLKKARESFPNIWDAIDKECASMDPPRRRPPPCTWTHLIRSPVWMSANSLDQTPFDPDPDAADPAPTDPAPTEPAPAAPDSGRFQSNFPFGLQTTIRFPFLGQ